MAIIIKTQLQLGDASRNFKKILDNSAKLKQNIADCNEELKKTIGLAERAAEAFAKMGGAMPSGRVPSSRGGGSLSSAGRTSKYNPGGRGSAFLGPPSPTAAQIAKGVPNSRGIGNPSKNPIMNALMRSRIDSSGNVMPLIMDLIKILPPQLQAPAAVALAAVKVFAKLMTDATQALGTYRQNLVMGGGSGGDARASGRLSQFTGTDVGGIGRNLMSGYGPIAAAGAGVNPFGGPFGDMDYNKKGLKIMDYIRRSKNFNEARQRAELAGAPEAASVKLLSEGSYGRLRSTSTGAANMTNIRAQAELDANMAALSDSFHQLEIMAVQPLISSLATYVGFASSEMELLSKIRDNLPVTSKLGLAGLLPDLGIAIWNKVTGGDHSDAVKDNTKAVIDNTRSMNQGINGGGERAQGAVGKGMNPLNPYWTNVPYGVI